MASATAGAAAAGTDPWWVWDDEIDGIMASLLDTGKVPAVNTAIKPWVNNNHPLPSGLPGNLATYLTKVNKLPAWADHTKLRLAADLTLSAVPFFIIALTYHLLLF